MTLRGADLIGRIGSCYQDVISRGLVASEGRSFEIVGVTKTLPVSTVLAGYHAGLRNFGENYATELISKASDPSLVFREDPLIWHFIGSIQSRTIRKLADHVSVWHSVCREKEVEGIAEFSPKASVFVQVNFSQGQHRNGVSLGEASELVNLCIEKGLQVLGLMVVPPIVDREKLKDIFVAVNLERLRLGLPGCSMGMSDDFELALSSGSTHIRLGRILFGDRGETGLLGPNLGQGGPG